MISSSGADFFFTVPESSISPRQSVSGVLYDRCSLMPAVPHTPYRSLITGQIATVGPFINEALNVFTDTVGHYRGLCNGINVWTFIYVHFSQVGKMLIASQHMEVLILTRGNADKQNLHIIQINYSPFGGFCFTYDQCVGLYIFFIFPFVPIYISLKKLHIPFFISNKKMESIKMFIPFLIFSNACI